MRLCKRDRYTSLEPTEGFSLNLQNMANFVPQDTNFTVTPKETIYTRSVIEQQHYTYPNMHCQFVNAVSSGNLLHNVAVNVLFDLYSISVFVS